MTFYWENLVLIIVIIVTVIIHYVAECGPLSFSFQSCYRLTPCTGRRDPNATDLNTSELVDLLQRSAVEHLTTYRQLVTRDFGSAATIVTTDWGAVRVQTWRLSAVFTVVYIERVRTVVWCLHDQYFDILGIHSVDGWWHCLTDCTDNDCQSWV